MDYTEAVRYVNWEDMFLGSIFPAFIKRDYDLMFPFLQILRVFITCETGAQVIICWNNLLMVEKYGLHQMGGGGYVYEY